MKIQQLLAREPFGAILTRTLAPYFDATFGRSHVVEWRRRSPWTGKSLRDGQNWYCNPWLNVLFVTEADSAILGSIRAEYRRTPVRFRGPVQQLYAATATAPMLARWFAPFVMQVAPALPNAGRLLLRGGNNRVRLVDFDRGVVCSILKNGFDSSYLAREIAVRRRPGDWPIPGLVSASVDSSWYEERYVAGVALNRLGSDRRFRHFETETHAVLMRWLSETRSEIAAADYVSQLAARAEALIGNSTLTTVEDQRSLLAAVRSAVGNAECLPGYQRSTLQLAVGHGDFQPGNIIIEGERYWLIDWEHSGQRQFVYDALVYHLKSRFPHNLTGRIASFLSGAERRHGHCAEWLAEAGVERRTSRLTLLVFLFEELCWYLEENRNPLFVAPSLGWLAFKSEFERALRVVAN